MGERIRSFDWSRTPLGPAASWPQSLKTAVSIMLTSRQPFWLGWGDELVKLYNDPYKAIVGGKHPWALGRPVSVVWREIWPEIGPMLETALGGVEGTYVEEQLLIMERNGYPEETYYTFSYSPIPNCTAGRSRRRAAGRSGARPSRSSSPSSSCATRAVSVKTERERRRPQRRPDPSASKSSRMPT